MVEKQSAYRMGWVLVMFDLPVLGVASRERGARKRFRFSGVRGHCLLYTSDAADE